MMSMFYILASLLVCRPHVKRIWLVLNERKVSHDPYSGQFSSCCQSCHVIKYVITRTDYTMNCCFNVLTEEMQVNELSLIRVGCSLVVPFFTKKVKNIMKRVTRL